jgi:outer membrane protein
MKNGLIIWNVVLSVIAGFLLFRQFAPSRYKGDKVLTHKLEDKDCKFRMAYFEMDSVSANYEMVKQVKAELSKKEEEGNAEMDGLSKRLQSRLTYFQDQAREGKLSQTQSDSVNQELNRMNEDLKLRRQQLDQEYNDLMVRKQNEIKGKIEEYLKEYNKAKNFSYIVSYEQGLFYYKDTIYNITADVVKGLNESFKASAKR